MASGIYVIRCKSTGKVYVGSSKDIAARWYQHKQQLKHGTHHSVKLQRAWDKYGKDDFEFEIVEEVIDGFLTVYEQIYINHYNSPVDGYNILKVAGVPRGRSVHQGQRTQYKSGNLANRSQKNPQKTIAKRKGLGRGRPGGNPDFGKKYKIQRKNDEPLDTLLAFRITRSMKEKLDTIPNKNEFCRNAIINALNEIDTLLENPITVRLYQEDSEELSSLAEGKDKGFISEFARDAVRKAFQELDEEFNQ